MRDLRRELEQRRREGLLRTPRALEGVTGPRMHVDGRDCLVFCSNDYLGLAGDPRIAETLAQAARAEGTGSGAAHLVTGHRPVHDAFEAELAEFLGRERALLFSTGYQANLGVIDALADRGDRVYQDRLNHASLLDGGRLSGARLIRYRHANAGDLRRRLQGAPPGALVVTDGVFSMDGDIAPLRGLAGVASAAGAWLMVDDAHGIGVLGPEGRGCVAAAALGADAVPVLVGTLGKAFGSFGAFVAGSAELIEFLWQRARTYVYTTAPPPALAAAGRKALALAREEGWRRERLTGLIRRFRDGMAGLGLPLMPSETPIQPIPVGDADAAMRLSDRLEAEGILVTAIRPPTVPAGTARLRVTLTAAHTGDDVDRLLSALARQRDCLTS
jgi:8-amino-7-oxononanoate synthase